MLSIYRRHKQACKHADDRVSKKCRCALWATGTLEGKPFRRALKTRSFERAEQLKRELENGVLPKEQPKSITIKDALDAFIRDCESRNLNTSTLRKYKHLRDNLTGFCERHGYHSISELGSDTLRRFREQRVLSARTAGKELERLRAFFKFCVENEWITKNPAKSIKAPQVKINPRIPFDETEIQAILSKAEDDRELAFLLVLRHTGLRIGDASLLRISALSDNRIHLYTTKAGTPVSILIPPNLVSLLKAIPPRGGYFFLRGESTSMHTTADLWRRRFKTLCREAGVTPPHPHRMRHTLAKDLLLKNVSVENVAAVLGNSPEIVRTVYAQWIKERQDALDAAIQSTWSTGLKLVK